MITSQKRVTGVSAPTGFGKTPSVIAFALLSGKPTCVVTASRGLQDQYMQDFESIGLVDLRGRSNYACEARPDCTCEEGHSFRCPCIGTIKCPHSQAEMRAATSRLVVTNYAKWTSARKWGQGMTHFEQVIFDEGHEVPQALADALQVTLSEKDFTRLAMDPPDDVEEFASWKIWAVKARRVAEAATIRAHGRILGVTDPKIAHLREYNHLKNLTRWLIMLATAKASDWVAEEMENFYQFDPIRPAKYAESAMLLKIPRIIIVSATLRPKTLHMLGIGKADYDFCEFDSDFDPKRCPIYYVPTMRVDARAKDLSPLWNRLDQIMAARRDRKGIVHTVSYARRDEITQRSRFWESMIVNPKGEAPTEMIQSFKASGPGTVLVSPSVGAGYDFPGRECEWQFMCKIPFQPPSKILKAREQDDPEYRSYQAMQKLVQTFGRGMRSREDSCENFIGDEHLDWFKPRFGHLAPKSFHGFFKRVEVLPQPPRRL